jgi:hypothetical protein
MKAGRQTPRLLSVAKVRLAPSSASAGGPLGSLDPRLPLWASAAACLINAGFDWFVLPESLPRRSAWPSRGSAPIRSDYFACSPHIVRCSTSRP